MPCDDLEAGLAEASRRGGDIAQIRRPAGGLSAVAHMAGAGICRTYSFAPPVVVPARQIISFADEAMVTFAGDYLYSF